MKKNGLLALILTLLILLSAASTVQAVEIVKSIPFFGPPNVMAYDSYKGAIWITTYYLYVEEMEGMPDMQLSASTKTVAAISDRDYRTLANVSVGKAPSSIAFDSARHEVFVTNSGTVSVISDDSNSVVATIDLSINSSNIGLSNIVYDSGKGEMFVSNLNSGVVSVILDSTREVVATIPLGTNPRPTSLIYDSGKGEIYVKYESLAERNPANFLSVISDATNSVIATVPLDNGVGSGAYDAATGEIYMPSNRSVLVISDITHTVIDSIPLEYNPICVAYDPVKSVLFAGWLNTTIISDKTKSVIETVPISCISMVYDTRKNMMIAIGGGSVQFVSDELSLSASPTPSVPEFSWLTILPLLLFITIALVMIRKRVYSGTLTAT
jgi:YVTN family beta-propeller protein